MTHSSRGTVNRNAKWAMLLAGVFVSWSASEPVQAQAPTQARAPVQVQVRQVRRPIILTGGPRVYFRGASPAFARSVGFSYQAGYAPAPVAYVPNVYPGVRMGSWRGLEPATVPMSFPYGSTYPGYNFGNGSPQVPGYFGGMDIANPYVFGPYPLGPYEPGGFPAVPFAFPC